MIITIILTKIMSSETFGEYRYYIAIFAMTSFFSLPETSKILIKYLPLKKNYLIKTLFQLKFKFSIIASFLFILISLYNLIQNNINEFIIFISFSLIYPLYYSFQIFDSILHAQQKFKQLSIHLIFRASIQALFVILTYYLTNNLNYAIVAYIFSYAIYNIYAFNGIKETKILYKKGTHYSDEKKETIALSLISIFAIVAENIDKILIAKFFSYEDLAFFTIGILIGKTFYSFLKVYINTYSPKLVNNIIPKRTYIFVFLIGTIFGIIASFVIEPFITFLYGEEYVKSTIYTKVLLLSTGVYAFSILYYNSYLYYYKNSVKLVYLHDILVPLFKILSITIILISSIPNDKKLIFLTIIFPITNIMSIIYIKYKKRKEQ